MDSDDDFNSDDDLDESDFDGLKIGAGSIFTTGKNTTTTKMFKYRINFEEPFIFVQAVWLKI